MKANPEAMITVADASTILRLSKPSLFSVLIVFIASLLVYSFTLAPTVTLVDSGELIVAAKSLGVAHPPGFPLYVMLAHLATMIPIGSIASRVNFASGFFAALASAMMTAVVFKALINKLKFTAKRSIIKDRGKKAKKSGPPAQSADVTSSPDKTTLIVSALVPGLFLAFSRTLWAYATIAEVYTLNSFLI